MRGFGWVGRLVAGVAVASLLGGCASAATPLPSTSAGDTAMLQSKLDTCVPGGPECTVQLPAGTYLTKQLVANGFHGSVVGAGIDKTIIQALPGYVVGGPGYPLNNPPSASNPYPFIMAFGNNSDVTVSDLTFRVTAHDPTTGWYYPPVKATQTWLDGAIYVRGSGRFTGLSFEGGAGTIAAEGTTGVNLNNAVVLDHSLPGSVFEMTRCRVASTGNGFELFNFNGSATVGGSPADANTFVNSSGGVYNELEAATVQESYNQIETNLAASGWYGVWVYKHDTTPANVTLAHNLIAENAADMSGVFVSYDGPQSAKPLGLVVTNNTFVVGGNGSNEGIRAENATGISISDNTITGKGTHAVDLKGTADGTVSGNTLSGFTPDTSAGPAQIYLDSGTTHNRVTCAKPGDTVRNLGISNTVTGCTAAQ